MDLIESHDLADIRVLFVDMRSIWDDATCAGDEAISESTICMGLSLADSSPFKFFSQSYSSLFRLPTRCI